MGLILDVSLLPFENNLSYVAFLSYICSSKRRVIS